MSGCQVLNRPDEQATLQAQNSGYLAEATAVAQTVQANQLQIQMTMVAVETGVARTTNINQQLLATIRAVVPPTPDRAVGSMSSAGASTEGDAMEAMPQSQQSQGSSSVAGTQFTNVGVAGAVRQSDGCAVSVQTSFPASTGVIYVTTRALNIRGGTVMAVTWQRQSQVVAQENWTVPRDSASFCLWFKLDSSVVPLTAGAWTVRLSADNNLIDPEVAFTVEG
jgi:hypothetical protein